MMRTVVLGPRPAELQAVIDRRSALGLDVHDEVGEGEYHLAPAGTGRHGEVQARLLGVLGPRARRGGGRATGPINVGGPDDFRVPDAAVLTGTGVDDVTWHPTAELVAEVRSPDDETSAKLGFYAEHGIDEVVVVDPTDRVVRIFVRSADGYQEQPASPLLGLTAGDLAAELDLA